MCRLPTILLSDNVTKQYKLVLVKGRWCPAARKVTIGLPLHWPWITDLSGLSIYWLNGLVRETSKPCLCSAWDLVSFIFFLPSISQRCLVKWTTQFTQFMLYCFPKTGWLCNRWLLCCMGSWISGKQCHRTVESDYLLHWHTLPVCFTTDQSHHPPCSPCLNKLLLQLICILDTRQILGIYPATSRPNTVIEQTYSWCHLHAT